MITLDTPLVDAVGKKSADKLHAAFTMRTVDDLLAHYPRRHYRIGDASSESGLQEGDHLSFVAEVRDSQWHPNRGASPRGRPKGRTTALLALKEGTIEAVFWNQPWMEKALPAGVTGLFSGVVGRFRGKWQLTSPTVERFSRPGEDAPGKAQTGLTFLNSDEWVGRLMPIYPSSAKIDSPAIRRCVELVLGLLEEVPDPLPDDLRKAQSLVGYDTALRHIHQPPTTEDLAAAQQRLKFHEALSTQLVLALQRADAQAAPATSYPARPGGTLEALDAQLPYALTEGQQFVGSELSEDLTRSHPMHRLLQGDVGSGKTVVALRAMLQVADGGGQSALLAPTEVLAHQHARSIGELLGPLGRRGQLDGHPDAIKVVVLTSGMPAKTRKAALLDIASGEATIVIGTHALLEPTVRFADLGLVVIDEQHRFGVEQRDQLRQKGREGMNPHTLVMTATPIPRTMAFTAFGALDSIQLVGMPPGRSAIATTAIAVRQNPHWLTRVWERIREEVDRGHQAYVVCPRINASGDEDDTVPLELFVEGESGEARLTSVEEMTEYLSSDALSGLRVTSLHGKMPADEKDRVMARFGAGEIDVLVSTTVIEVGVDVPNATVMVVADADRFGLATLHQLRGRVGRGDAPGVCLLLSVFHDHSQPFQRLKVLEETGNGFEIAERDLQFRREGDILGVEQSGTRSRLRLLKLDEVGVIESARELCEQVVGADPTLERHPGLQAELDRLHRLHGGEFLYKS